MSCIKCFSCLFVILFIWMRPSQGADGLKGTEAPATVKNVLMIISDDLKADALPCYGDSVCETPNLDALAASGMVFDRAYCQGTWCAPSRLSFMYSRYLGNRGRNLGEHFRDQGAYTARVGKIYHMRVPGDIIAGTDGQDVATSWTQRFNSPGQEAHTPGDYACLNQDIFTIELANRQSTGMPHRPYVTVQYDGDGSDQPDHKSATQAIELLRQRARKTDNQSDGQPWLLAVGMVRPHYPMVAPRQYFDPYPWQSIKVPDADESELADIPKLGLTKSRDAINGMGKYPDNKKRMWQGYYASIAFVDEQIGRIVSELQRLGLRESTAIVFTSDHGYHLGEHTFWQKANLHDEVNRVPLIISVPGMKPGRTDSLVELLDLYPTLASLAGHSIPDDVQGIDVTPILLNPDTQVRKAALTLDRSGNSIRTEAWAYIRYNDDTEELYDMQADPDQLTNLAGEANREAVLVSLRAQLDERLSIVEFPAKKKPAQSKKKQASDN